MKISKSYEYKYGMIKLGIGSTVAIKIIAYDVLVKLYKNNPMHLK